MARHSEREFPAEAPHVLRFPGLPPAGDPGGSHDTRGSAPPSATHGRRAAAGTGDAARKGHGRPPGSGGPAFSSPAPPGGPRLRDVWERSALPSMVRDGRSKYHVRDCARTVAAWERSFLERRLPEPAAAAVKTDTLRSFRDHLAGRAAARDRPLSPHTLDKRAGVVRSILARAAAEGATLAPPAPPARLSRPRRRAATLTDAEAVRLLEAFGPAGWPDRDPRGFPLAGGPAAQWRAAVLMFLLYGLRTHDLIGGRCDRDPLRWERVNLDDALTPDPAGGAWSDHGWFWTSPMKSRKGSDRVWNPFAGDPTALPLTAASNAALRSIRPRAYGPSTPVFDWPENPSRLREEWRSALGRAGIGPRRRWGARPEPVVRRTLRRWTATRMALHRPKVVGIVLCHAPESVSAASYVQSGPLLAEAYATWPEKLPEALTRAS